MSLPGNGRGNGFAFIGPRVLGEGSGLIGGMADGNSVSQRCVRYDGKGRPGRVQWRSDNTVEVRFWHLADIALGFLDQRTTGSA
jgi:hypothetical protein